MIDAAQMAKLFEIVELMTTRGWTFALYFNPGMPETMSKGWYAQFVKPSFQGGRPSGNESLDALIAVRGACCKAVNAWREAHIKNIEISKILDPVWEFLLEKEIKT